MLTFASGSAYDGENFAWFGERYRDFRYLDRIVIHADFRRRGLGTRVYDELEDGPAMLALEVNLDPPNEPSLAFHRSRGYEEVGRRSFQEPHGHDDDQDAALRAALTGRVSARRAAGPSRAGGGPRR